MKSFWRYILSILITCAFFSAASRADELPTLPEQVFPSLDLVLKQTLKQSPRMLLQQLSLTMAEGDKMQAKSGLYPSVGGFYQRSQTRDERQDITGTLDTTKTYYSVSLTQPIFYWGERVNNAKVGIIREKIAQKQYTEAYRMLAQDVRSAYLSLIFTKCQLASARFSRTLADEALRLGEERVNKKVIAEADIFQARLGAEQAALSVETLEGNYMEAKHTYEILTGMPAPADDQIPDSIPSLSYDKSVIDRLLATFLSQDAPSAPSMDVMRKQIDVDVLSYKNTRKRLLPKLNLVVGVSQDEQSYSLNVAQKYGVLSRYAGLQVNWSIFDGFATRGAIASALAQKRQDEQKYRIAVEALQHQVQVVARGIDLAYKQMAINDRLLDNSMQFLKYRRENFKDGRASETDVNNAQAGYNSALVSANGARQNYLMSVAGFLSLMAVDPSLQNVDFKDFK